MAEERLSAQEVQSRLAAFQQEETQLTSAPASSTTTPDRKTPVQTQRLLGTASVSEESNAVNASAALTAEALTALLTAIVLLVPIWQIKFLLMRVMIQLLVVLATTTSLVVLGMTTLPDRVETITFLVAMGMTFFLGIPPMTIQTLRRLEMTLSMVVREKITLKVAREMTSSTVREEVTFFMAKMAMTGSMVAAEMTNSMVELAKTLSEVVLGMTSPLVKKGTMKFEAGMATIQSMEIAMTALQVV